MAMAFTMKESDLPSLGILHSTKANVEVRSDPYVNVRQDPKWYRLHHRDNLEMKHTTRSEISLQHAYGLHGPKTFLELFHRRLGDKAYMSTRHSTTESCPSYYDLNDLPFMSHMKSFFLVICTMSFFVAPGVYMPLGSIQAAYDQRCFLYTNIKLRLVTQMINGTVAPYKIYTFDAAATEWGSVHVCHFTTFMPVSVAIFSLIIGFSTFTVWPAMMALGRGGALMILYALLAILSVVATSMSVHILTEGYEESCNSLIQSRDKRSVTCAAMNNREVIIHEVLNSHAVKDIHSAMMFAEVAGWLLVGLETGKVLISAGTFVIIWVHFHFIPEDLYDSEDELTDSSSEDEREITKTLNLWKT